MNDKTGKAIAASVSDLAKALNRLAVAHEKQVRYGGPIPGMYSIPGMSGGGPVIGTWTGGGGGGEGGVGGRPGGVHPVGGRGGSGAGGAALAIVASTPIAG